MSLQTGRDQFARLTIRKRLVKGECGWCGATRVLVGGHPQWHHRDAMSLPKLADKGKTWEYYADADSPRESGVIGRACGIECLRALMG